MIKVTSHPNIAFIKYWGKADDVNIRPLTSSISIQIKDFITTTILEESNKNTLILNNKEIKNDDISFYKTFKYINTFQNYLKEKGYNKKNLLKNFKITTNNNFLTKAGLSSSSSGISALTKALNKYYENFLSLDEMIEVSRLGSGSSCRSFLDNFCIWDRNNSVRSIKNPFKLHFFVITIDTKEKKYPSTLAMKESKDSLMYKRFFTDSKKHFKKALLYIKTKNFRKLSDISLKNFLLMHKTVKYSKLQYSYITKESEIVLKKLIRVRKIYNLLITMDAGSNVKVFCLKKDKEKVKNMLLNFNFQIIESRINDI